jgi:hypothetical protein
LLTFVIVIPFIVGIPVSFLLNSNKDSPAYRLFAFALFLGIAIIILPLQTLVYLNIPIRQSYYLIWIITALLWFWVYKKKINKQIFKPYLPIIVVIIFVCLLHAVGLFIVGAKYYVGRAWNDAFNYTIIAQYLARYAFDSSITSLAHQPFAFSASYLVKDRIGQSIFQAFIMSATGLSAKTTYGPTIMLSIALVAIVSYSLARFHQFSKKTSTVIAWLSASLPSIALIHFDSFFSQALATPFLLV